MKGGEHLSVFAVHDTDNFSVLTGQIAKGKRLIFLGKPVEVVLP
jgi:hypothetical protein